MLSFTLPNNVITHLRAYYVLDNKWVEPKDPKAPEVQDGSLMQNYV